MFRLGGRAALTRFSLCLRREGLRRGFRHPYRDRVAGIVGGFCHAIGLQAGDDLGGLVQAQTFESISKRYAQFIIGGIALEWAAIETSLDLMVLVAYAGGDPHPGR